MDVMGKEGFINQINNKEPDGFKLLYTNYYKSLILFALTYVSEEDVAKDLVQDIIVSIWEQTIDFDSETAFKTYLYNAVRNKCLNHLKHLKVQEKHEAFVKSDQVPEDRIDDEIEEQEIYRKVFAAIDKLPPRCKEVFELHLKGKKNSEIAELLQISIETVKVQKKRAMKSLRVNVSSVVVLLLFSDIL